MVSLGELVGLARARGPLTCVVAQAADPSVLEAVEGARREGFCRPVLVGVRKEIEEAARSACVPIVDLPIAEVSSRTEAAAAAVAMVRRGEGQVLVKGLLQTADLLRCVLDKESGIATGRTLSHVGVFAIPRFDRLLLVTDAGMAIAPDLRQKADIVQNAIDVARALGIAEPVVAILAAVEHVNPAMPATIDAAALSKMADRGAITGGKVEGPLALDCAVDVEAARHKGISSPLAGRADILVAPDIEAANILYKALTFLAGAQDAGIVVGAKLPIVVTSRADSAANKMHSLALAALVR